MDNEIRVILEQSSVNNSDTIIVLFGMRDVRDVECSGFGMLGMWDVPDRVFGINDVRKVGCSGSGMFGM